MPESLEMDIETILGVRFFRKDVREAVDRMLQGGLLVVPAAPALKDLQTQPGYRDALLRADMVIPDSAYMVLIWNNLLARRAGRPRLQRVSGLEYLRELLQREAIREPGSTLWVMPSEMSSAQNVTWLTEQGITVPATHVYEAPIYPKGAHQMIEDARLLGLIETLRPAHVIVSVGGGTQERLGLYLRENLSYVPGVHCIGAAIAFLSGDQVNIPVWADRMYLGWLFRILDDPKRYGSRYWDARKLMQLMLRYGSSLPPVLAT